MTVKYIGDDSSPMSLVTNNKYKCIGIEKGWYRVIDETGEDYLYPPELFELVEK